MCGIAGLIGFAQLRPGAEQHVSQMLDLMAHRGPDDAGVWTNGRVALGNRRLAILDLSVAGHQPMLAADGSVVVVQNGEIYNYRELRRELVQAGYTFHSDCDTEVLLHGYAHWGVELFRRLRGMYAIAVWSEREQRLVLARDRFGIKPLYYQMRTEAGGQCHFASEIKPLFLGDSAGPRANMAVTHDFLAYGVLEHTSETFFAGIDKLPPAHYMTIHRDGAVELHRYWDLEINAEIGTVSPEEDERAAHEFREAFLDSVRHHLISDVPLGSCLSGGLDSSSVVCAVNHLRAEAAHGTPDTQQWTFTSCFEDLRFDERSYAQAVIRATHAQAHFTFPTCAGFLEELPQLLHHQEEPFASTSIYAQWCLMRDIHRSGLKVVLDGQGGDEQLLGYGKYYYFYLKLLARQGRLEDLAREGVAVALAHQFWRSLHFRHGLRYMAGAAGLRRDKGFMRTDVPSRLVQSIMPVRSRDDFAELIKRDLTTFSLPALLRYEDKNSMAFSVESRVPFVDHVLAEHMAALPLRQKLRNGWTKYILRQGLRDLLPAAIRNRKSKMGFETPEAVWSRNELAPEIQRTLANAEFLPELVDVPRLCKAFASYCHRPGWRSHGLFFRFFIVERWARQFLLSSIEPARNGGHEHGRNGAKPYAVAIPTVTVG